MDDGKAFPSGSSGLRDLISSLQALQRFGILPSVVYFCIVVVKTQGYLIGGCGPSLTIRPDAVAVGKSYFGGLLGGK